MLIKKIYSFWLPFKMSITLVAITFIILFITKKIKHKQLNRIKTQATSQNKLAKKTILISHSDIKAISGGDELATQLDLARAYIELGNKKIAKQILQHVLHYGSPVQKMAANDLMTGL